ncbi:MAG: TIGR00725 family protein [Actinomycetota bacterium]
MQNLPRSEVHDRYERGVGLVAVVGPGEAGAAELAAAYAVGAGLARAGALVLTGGLGGVMAAASRGAAEAGGVTVGLLPGTDPGAANPWVRVPLATGLGEGRNLLLVRAAAVLVAVGGSWGTLSEVALAVRTGTPVVAWGGWEVRDARGAPVPGVRRAATPEEAVAQALAAHPPTGR